MLTRVVIENFRCFRHLDVPLRPLTVLIGANDTGKSAFCESIVSLTRNEGYGEKDCWRQDKKNRVTIGVSFDTRPKQILQHDSPARQNITRELQPLVRFLLPSAGLPMSSEGVAEASTFAPDLGSDGSGVPTLVDFLLRRDRRRFFAFVDAARSRIPGLDDLAIATPSSSTRRIDLVVEGGLTVTAERASAGVRLLLFFLALAFHPNPPKLIIIEEPENGLHPKRLADVMRLFRDITEGKLGGHKAQVVLTTHSPYLLDCVDLSKDQVLVFRRNDDGSRTAEPADAERLKTFLDEFLLGEIWYNQGEEGLVRKP
jgi:predicted ATPase